MYPLYSLIEIVLIIAFFALIIGLIRPTIVIHWGEKRTRGKVLLYYGLGMIFLSIISGLIKPEEIRKQETQQRVERLQKQQEQEAREQEQKEKERQQQLQQAQPILEKAKQQLNSARNAYTSGKFKNAIASAQQATNTLKTISHISAPEISSLDNQAMSLITDAREALANAPDYILSANQLYREYQNNEVAADIKYKGKIVLVSGTIHDISKDILGKPFIVIGGSGFFDGAQCSFTRNQESVLGRLSKGQHVKIKGKVSGKFGHVQVENCTLQ